MVFFTPKIIFKPNTGFGYYGNPLVTRMKYNLSGGRQKTRVSGGRHMRRVIWWSPEEKS